MEEEIAKSSTKPRRSFVEAWLNDDRYKSWIGKVPHDDSSYYCSVCKRDFSCNASHVSRHGNSAWHQKKLKVDLTLHSDDDDETVQTKIQRKFKNEWLDLHDFKLWVRPIPSDDSIVFCTICEKTFSASLSHIRRHAKSRCHVNICEKKGITISKSNDDLNTQDAESNLLFDDRKKSAEIKFAALIIERNIPHQTAQDVLNFFQHIESEVLKNMSMGENKCSNIISNVLHPIENERIVSVLQIAKFSIFIDVRSDICNKKWMSFFARYVDPETLDIHSQLVKLINLDSKDFKRKVFIKKLFQSFKRDMKKLQIPIANIIALSYDDSPVPSNLNEFNLLFQTKLEEECKNLLIFPCLCHSLMLAAHAACTKLPSVCNVFLQKIVNYIINTSKRTENFREFCECFKEKYCKSLKLSKVYWLSHYTYVEKLLESWNAIEQFLKEMSMNDKTKSAEYLLSLMGNLEVKAYFLFLKYVLDFFNSFITFFQSTETRIHLLQSKFINLLNQVCENFVKNEYLENAAIGLDFSCEKVRKNINEIVVGSDCAEYLGNLLMEDYEDIVTNVRNNCLQFYLTAAEEIRKRLPVTHDFLTKLQIFESSPTLYDDDRETSFEDVSFVAKTLGMFDESLKNEWLSISADFSMKEKLQLSRLNFDEMWKEILQRELDSSNTCKYPNLKVVLNAVRSLPNSNVHLFSDLTDLRTRQCNELSSTCINTTDETAASIVSKEYFSDMSDHLYATSQEESSLSLDNADDDAHEIVGLSFTTL